MQTYFMSLPHPAQPEASLRLAVHEAGSATSRRTAICLHGLTRNGQDFAFLADDLAPTHHVLAPDMPGRGKSDWLTNPMEYSYPIYLLLVEHWLQSMGKGAVDWIGTSMGGLMGMMLAATNPARIRKLVLNDVGPFLPASALESIGEYVGREPQFESREAAERYLRVRLRDFGVPPLEKAWAHLLEHTFEAHPAGGLRLAYDPAIAIPFQNPDGTPKKMADLDLWPLWELIQCPVLVIRGERSGLLNRETLDRMQHQRPGLTVLEVPDAGHAPSLMTQREREAILHFLLAGS